MVSLEALNEKARVVGEQIKGTEEALLKLDRKRQELLSFLVKLQGAQEVLQALASESKTAN